MQKIIPYLWFDHNVEEVAKFYTSVFKNAKILNMTHFLEAGKEIHGKEAGTVMTVEFEIEGQKFVALNGGPAFKFTPAISFFVNCKDQAEVDYYWEKLSADPSFEQCGWIKDKYGVSWQIVPEGMGEMLNSPDKDKAGRAMEAMLEMKKLDLAKLKEAYEGNN